MVEWEYKLVSLMPSDLSRLQSICNEWGGDGWEIIQIGMVMHEWVMVMKRPNPNALQDYLDNA